ncbi:MAG: hypothetical protein H6828_14735 [Planctomycetes bacterium]|nr:hypothetical protein [Planctomycetota bacterium]
MLQDLVEQDAWRLQFPEGEEGMTLQQFVKICQQNTGINFTFTKDTEQLLNTTKVQMFGPKVIPKKDFYSFFQIIMIINKFVCTRIGPEHMSVVVVSSMDSQARTSVRADAVYITPEEVPSYADQPATLVQTVLNLPNLDVRTLGNSLRQFIVDPNTLVMIPVPESNSLILVGFGSHIAALAHMLDLMNEVAEPESPVLPEFDVVPLEYAAADEIADTLEELLEASRRAAQAGAPQQPAQGPTGRLQTGSTEAKIMVQPRANALLVMAMPEDMPRIKELVARLDVDVIDRERNYHFISLENADAEELADTLTEFLQDASRVENNTPGGAAARPQGAAGSNSSEIAVVPDSATNSLLVAAPRSRFQEIQDMITRLDRRQDQVLIETALIELSGRDFLDLGVELGGANIPGQDAYGGFGVSSFDMSDFVDNNNDGVPDVRTPNLTRGLTAGIIDGSNFSLPVLVSALQERRNTNVLNIPSVLVNNNGSARVTTLDEQPTTTITTNGQGQTQENFNGYEPAGITLEISPTISASNYLRLSVALEVSTFQGSFSGAIPPPKITRTIDTIVNVPDGYTMVIGGIIVDNKTNEKDQVPFLGDIPFLGVLFRRSQDTQDRTTLYFFVTPHIMHDREFADLAAYSYQRKLDAADTIGANRVRLIDPKFGLDNEALDLGGFDLPIYQAPVHGEVDQAELGLESQDVNEMLDSDKR